LIGEFRAAKGLKAKTAAVLEALKYFPDLPDKTFVASEFVAGVLVGALVGYGLDYVFHTLPLFLIIFLLAGFGAGIVNMSRAGNRIPPTPEELANMPKPADDEDEDK